MALDAIIRDFSERERGRLNQAIAESAIELDSPVRLEPFELDPGPAHTILRADDVQHLVEVRGVSVDRIQEALDNDDNHVVTGVFSLEKLKAYKVDGKELLTVMATPVITSLVPTTLSELLIDAGVDVDVATGYTISKIALAQFEPQAYAPHKKNLRRATAFLQRLNFVIYGGFSVEKAAFRPRDSTMTVK